MLGSSREEMIAVLGDPVSVRSEPQPNRHVPGEIDVIHYLEWQGLQVTVHQAPVVDREFLAGVVATGRTSVPASSWIGRTREELIEELGEPVRSTGVNASTWECFNELAPETVTAEFENGSVTRVTVSYPID